MRKLLFVCLFLSTLVCNAQPPSYVPTNGLVGWWPFNGNANDESGNGNNGTVNGATLTTDRFGNAGKAYYFSSNGCATRVDATINTSSIQTGLTISIWVMRSGNGCISPRLLEIYNTVDGPGSSQWGWENQNSTGFGSRTSTGFGAYSTFNIKPDNIWTNLTYTNDGSFAKFYQDGLLINSIASSGTPILGQNAAFGRMNHPAYDAFNGKLDDIGIWNRALTQSEITGLYNAGTNTCLPSYLPTTGLVGY